MPVKSGNEVLRVSLSKDLIKRLKKRAIDRGVQPNKLVDQALRVFLGDESEAENGSLDR